MLRATWLVLAMALACGGRAVEPDDPGSGAGGKTGGRQTDGGAAPTWGGAVGSSAGGWLASGGAFASGGAVTTGGKSSVEDVLLMKFCGAYCAEAFNTCPFPMADAGTCRPNCVAEGKSNGPECQASMINLLQCASNALLQATDFCVNFPPSVGMCQAELDEARKCGFSLPGAESCMTSFIGTSEACTRIQSCGSVTFAVSCQLGVGEADCKCNVNGQESFGITWFDDVSNWDCGVAALSLACGPSNTL